MITGIGSRDHSVGRASSLGKDGRSVAALDGRRRHTQEILPQRLTLSRSHRAIAQSLDNRSSAIGATVDVLAAYRTCQGLLCADPHFSEPDYPLLARIRVFLAAFGIHLI